MMADAPIGSTVRLGVIREGREEEFVVRVDETQGPRQE
jgi:hypothetical protein